MGINPKYHTGPKEGREKKSQVGKVPRGGTGAEGVSSNSAVAQG